MHPFIETQKEWMKDVAPFRAGDTVRVNVRVKVFDAVKVLVGVLDGVGVRVGV